MPTCRATTPPAIIKALETAFARAMANPDHIKKMEEVGLAADAERPASALTLSGQKRLEIARAVATGGRLVMLDEVMAGLTPTEVAQMLQTVRQLHAGRGLTLLVIEHVMRALMELCERIVVLHHGQLIAEGTPEQIGRDAQVHAGYFGGGA